VYSYKIVNLLLTEFSFTKNTIIILMCSREDSVEYKKKNLKANKKITKKGVFFLAIFLHLVVGRGGRGVAGVTVPRNEISLRESKSTGFV